ncbi:MAG: PLP-dependent aminotransferase family protein [Acidobacteriota bacterium]|nr:PLP-dependent aminotransferase family protein [Blastocatellia bacterium]MDW8413154.1 PLP-dependent aminotransferase family protein [Acidobacteriota bacterium]
MSLYASRLKPNAIRALAHLINRPSVISFAGGVPSSQTFPADEIAEIAARLIRERGSEVLQYGVTRGRAELIRRVCDYMRARSIEAVPEQVILTAGSQQALDLLCRVLLDPGDVVIVEAPSYIGALCAIRNSGARIVAVDLDDDGIKIDELELVLRQSGRSVKFIYTVTNFQNPSGVTLSSERRQQLMDLANRYDVMVVEDDPYGELYFEHSPPRPIKSLDEEQKVVYLGSFSKMLAPGLRTGWAVGPTGLIRLMELAKEAADLCSGGLDQALVEECLSCGLLERRLPVLRDFYKLRCQTMLEALSEYAPQGVRWTYPRGGFFVWVWLDNMDATSLLEVAVEQGVAFVPGQPFFADEQVGGNTLRLAFSKETPQRVSEGISKLMMLIRQAQCS